MSSWKSVVRTVDFDILCNDVLGKFFLLDSSLTQKKLEGTVIPNEPKNVHQPNCASVVTYELWYSNIQKDGSENRLHVCVN
jgi:hypothetical protein